jgi:hypothetical protein
LFPKRGLSPTEENPPLKRGIQGDLSAASAGHRLEFFKKLLGHHTRCATNQSVCVNLLLEHVDAGQPPIKIVSGIFAQLSGKKTYQQFT